MKKVELRRNWVLRLKRRDGATTEEMMKDALRHMREAGPTPGFY